MSSKKHTTIGKVGVYILASALAIIALQESCPESLEMCSLLPDFRLLSDDLARWAMMFLCRAVAVIISIPSLDPALILREFLTLDMATYCGTFSRDFLHKLGFLAGGIHNNCHETYGLTSEDFAEKPTGPLPRHWVLVFLLMVTLTDLIGRYEDNQLIVEEELAFHRLHANNPVRGRHHSPVRPTNPDQSLNNDSKHSADQDNEEEVSANKETQGWGRKRDVILVQS